VWRLIAFSPVMAGRRGSRVGGDRRARCFSASGGWAANGQRIYALQVPLHVPQEGQQLLDYGERRRPHHSHWNFVAALQARRAAAVLERTLRGDMSLVGPRPKLPHHEALCMACRPGITGVATLAFRKEEEFLSEIPEDQLEIFYETFVKPAKAQLDLEYMRSATLRKRC
jgi:hypothetical protein